VTKILTPPQPAPVMDIARGLLPPGMERVVVDPGEPEFHDAAGDSEYFWPPRTGRQPVLPRRACKLKFGQLTSAATIGVDVETTCKAEAPTPSPSPSPPSCSC